MTKTSSGRRQIYLVSVSETNRDRAVVAARREQNVMGFCRRSSVSPNNRKGRKRPWTETIVSAVWVDTASYKQGIIQVAVDEFYSRDGERQTADCRPACIAVSRDTVRVRVCLQAELSVRVRCWITRTVPSRQNVDLPSAACHSSPRTDTAQSRNASRP